MREQRESMREQRESMRESNEGACRRNGREQESEAARPEVSSGSLVGLSSGRIYIYFLSKSSRTALLVYNLLILVVSYTF